MQNKNLKLWLTLSAIFLISGTTVGVVLYSLHQDQLLVDRVSAIRDRTANLASIRTAVVDSETAQRGYLITGNPAFLEPLEESRQQLDKVQKALRRQFVADARMTELNSALEKLITLHYENIKATLGRAAAGKFGQAEQMVARGQGRAIMEEIRVVIGDMERYHQDKLKATLAERDSAMLWARIATIALGALILVLITALAYIIDRELRYRELYQDALNQEVGRLSVQLRERAEELDTLSTHLQTSIEKERAQLARDLHDEFGGLLTTLKIDLAWIEGKAEAYDAALAERTLQVSERVNALIDLKRRVIENLRPSLLDNLGVEAALTWYARDVAERAGLKLELDIDTLTPRPAPEISITLFRIAQEALVNSVKYAQATAVGISLKMVNGALVLKAYDNGIGMDMPGRAGKTLTHGLASMKHRALTLKGRFHIETAPGQGTIIVAEIPQQPGAASAAALNPRGQDRRSEGRAAVSSPRPNSGVANPASA